MKSQVKSTNAGANSEALDKSTNIMDTFKLNEAGPQTDDQKELTREMTKNALEIQQDKDDDFVEPFQQALSNSAKKRQNKKRRELAAKEEAAKQTKLCHKQINGVDCEEHSPSPKPQKKLPVGMSEPETETDKKTKKKPKKQNVHE